jgi:hypothetical protein
MESGLRETFDRPAWRTAVGTAASYTLILLAMFLLLFALPFAVFLVF